MQKILLLTISVFLTVFSFAQRPSKEQMAADKKKYEEAKQKLNKQMESMSPEARKGFDSLMNAMGMGQKINDADNQVYNNKAMPQKKNVGLAKKQPTDIPQKQFALLNSVPKITNASQYEAYLNKLKSDVAKNVDAATKSGVDFLVNANKNQSTALNNIPVMYFMEKNVEAAVYASILVAIINKNVPVSQGNIAAILQQSGYPQYAIPLLEYLNSKYKSDMLQSNLGQAYLSLGDKEKAKTCFMKALSANSANVSANCGMGVIEANGSNPSAAAPYIEKVMKNGYSETLDKLVTQKNIKLNYKSMKVKVPAVFSPEKYKVVPTAFNLDEVEETLSKRLQIHRTEEDWIRKLQKANSEFDKATTRMDNNQKLALWGGFTTNTFLAKKAKFMSTQADLYWTDFSMRIAPEYNSLLLKMQKIEKDLKERITKISIEIPDAHEACNAKKEALNTYLQKTSELVNDFTGRNIYDFYDYTDQQLYWNRFLVNQTMYNQKFYQYAHYLLKAVDDYSGIQPLNAAHMIVYNCEKQTAAKKPSINGDENPQNCPFSYKIALGAGAFKASCNGWSIEGGEIITGTLSKDYKSGEFTIGMGMGANIEAPFLGGSAGAEMFITVGSDFIPSDLGVKGSAGIEASAGPVVIGSESITATMSIANGLNLDAAHAGQEIKLFQLSPKK
ncbi:MAG TPA: tetratricopeptide repeat protein [Ferruginibacter sp.]|nr:tetratricopeptide repeat protein [Ferruginibacter sp.]